MSGVAVGVAAALATTALVIALSMPGAGPAQSDWTIEAAERAARSSVRCRAAGLLVIPAADRPSAAQRQALQGCSSGALYYGIGRPIDFIAARHCAIMEIGSDDSDLSGVYFKGEAMLAMIYANGDGVQRDLTVAMAAACAINNEAPAAMWHRTEALEARSRSKSALSRFDLCDGATSSFSAIHCVARDRDLADQQRLQLLSSLVGGRNPGLVEPARATYAAMQHYLSVAHGMDCFRGTLMAACTEEGIDRGSARFLAIVRSLYEPEKQPKGSAGSGYRPNAAFLNDAQWAAFLADIYVDDREWYRSLRDDTRAARRQFERRLLAFTRQAFPGRSDQEVRWAFHDF